MSPLSKEVWSYAKLIVSKWIFWAITALDIIFFLASLFWPEIQTSVPVYGFIALVGFLVAAFQVNRDQVSRIPGAVLPRVPKVALELEDGNQYSYQWHDWSKSVAGTLKPEKPLTPQSSVPWSRVTIHAILRNVGEVPVDVLRVWGRSEIDFPFQFMLFDGRNRTGSELIFPIHLDPKQNLLIDLVAPIQPSSLSTDAQVAVRSRAMLADPRKGEFEASVAYSDSEGTEYHKKINSVLSLTPLVDMYIAHWREIARQDLVRLATGSEPISG